ncbi:MAG: DUF3105 domain-containing protein [Marmoricola sp.]
MAKRNAAAKAAERAEAERLAAEKQRREKIRAWFLLGAIGVAVLGLVALLLVPYVRDIKQRHRIENLPLSDVGTSAGAAGCAARELTKVTVPKAGWHVKNGTPLTYDQAPPAYGKHWAVPLQKSQYRTIFTAKDRPAKELLVHSLEHGYTVIWFDATAAADPTTFGALTDLSERFRVGDGVVIVPWTAADGGAFPGGAHVALTHWTGPKNQRGVHQYCTGVSGAAVKSFITDYPRKDAPEPGAV